MKVVLSGVLAGALMLGGAQALGAEAVTSGLAKQIQAASPASAEGSRKVISLLHAALLQPPSQVTSEARGVCVRYLPTAIAGMTRGHVATCALRADAFEALATCAWLSGDRKTAKDTLVSKLSLLDCPAEGVDGVRRSTRLAASWLWPEAMEKVVFRQRTSLAGRSDASARSLRSVQRNVAALAEARRQRKAISAALGKRKPGGLLVLSSGPGTSAAKAGLRPDDVIVVAGTSSVRGLRQLRKLSLKASTTPLTAFRRGAPVQMVLRGGLDGLEAVEVPMASPGR